MTEPWPSRRRRSSRAWKTRAPVGRASPSRPRSRRSPTPEPRRPGRRRAQVAVAAVPWPTFGRSRDPDADEALAAEALARGDGRGTVRHAFLAALGELEQRERLPRGRHRTNAELAALLGAASLARPFS